jgi:hypothetical protein
MKRPESLSFAIFDTLYRKVRKAWKLPELTDFPQEFPAEPAVVYGIHGSLILGSLS